VLRLLRQVSWNQLRASWGRTTLVIAGVATGVSLIVAIDIINTTVVANLRSTIEIIAGPAALEVTLGVGEIGFDERAAEVARRDPDVVSAIPLVRGTVALARDPGETLQLLGADLTTETDLAHYHVNLTTDGGDMLEWLNDPRSIALTTEVAHHQGIVLGQILPVSTPQGVKNFTVRGLLEPEGLARAFGGQLALMDLPAAQLLLGKGHHIDQLDLVLRDGADVGDVRQRIGRALGQALGTELTVERPAQRGGRYERIFASFQSMLTGISTICLVAGIFIIYNTTSTGAVNRAGTIAQLQLIGAESRMLFRLLMIEAFALGLIGTVGGAGTGILLARALSSMVADSMAVIYKLKLPVTVLAIDVRRQALIALVGPAAALLASYFAARRVTLLEPLEMLRSGSAAAVARPRPSRLVRWWIGLIALSVCALVVQTRWRPSFAPVAFGNFGATLWSASVIVIAIPIVIWSAAGLSRLLPRLFAAEGAVAAASLFRSPTRTGVTVAAIALVVTSALTLTSLSISFRESVADYVGKLFAADLVVSALSTEGGYLETPLPGKVIEKLRRIRGVASVDAVRALPGQLYRGRRIGVLALTDGFFRPSRYPAEWYREGSPARALETLRNAEGANVSTVLADAFGLHVGDRIDLDTPTGRLSLPIAGVVPDFISDGGSIIVNRTTFVAHWQDGAVTRILLELAPGADAPAVRRRIMKSIGRRFAIKALSLREVLEYHDQYRRRAFAFTDAIQLLIVIVTVAGILDLLFSAIAERRRELALWRLIGADESSVRRSVIIESATIGTLAALLGIPVGAVTAWLWVRFNFPSLLGYAVTFHFPATFATWYVLLVMACTVLAGFIAAQTATRQRILDGIRAE
jgi:putative ABC transport system permease protein